MRFFGQRSARTTTVALVLLLALIGMVMQLVRFRSSTPHVLEAVEVSQLSKDEAIERVEKLGGKVGIDAEQADQPVWMVDFTDVPIDDAALELLKVFTMLEVLHLDKTPTTDVHLRRIGDIHTLRELTLAETRITDDGLKHLSQLAALQRLSLHGTAVTDAGLKHLIPLKNLTDILHADTAITEAGIAAFEAGQLADGIQKGGTVEMRRNSPEKISTAPNNGQRLNQIGRLALISARGDAPARDRAVATLERAVQAEPANDEFKLDLADAYTVLNLDLTLALATELYEDVLKRRPDDQQLLGRLVKAYSALQNAPRAFEYAERRLKLTPAAGAYDVALQVVGIVAAGGKIQRGLTLERAALQKNPDDKGVQLLLATLQMQAQDDPAATLILRKVLAQSPVGQPYHDAAQKLLTELEKKQ